MELIGCMPFCKIICFCIAFGILLIFLSYNGPEYGECYHNKLICNKCGKASEHLMLCGSENEYDYTCPYCGNVMRW